MSKRHGGDLQGEVGDRRKVYAADLVAGKALVPQVEQGGGSSHGGDGVAGKGAAEHRQHSFGQTHLAQLVAQECAGADDEVPALLQVRIPGGLVVFAEHTLGEGNRRDAALGKGAGSHAADLAALGIGGGYDQVRVPSKLFLSLLR